MSALELRMSASELNRSALELRMSASELNRSALELHMSALELQWQWLCHSRGWWCHSSRHSLCHRLACHRWCHIRRGVLFRRKTLLLVVWWFNETRDTDKHLSSNRHLSL